MASSGVDKALELMRTLPRITFNALRNSVGAKKPKERARGRYGGKTHGAGQKGSGQRQAYIRLGHEGGQTPFYLKFSKEPYYKGHHLKHEHLPISLHQIQMLIDTGRLNAEEPIDLTQICNTKLFKLDPLRKQYGFQITDEGLDCFSAKLNLEVQYAPEHVIAAVEKNGGVITTAFYDMISLSALINPERFFQRGVPIPRRMLPPQDQLVRYSDPKFRGYLADPDKIAEERFMLSQKYGYKLPDLSTDPLREMLLRRKDPRQVFCGLMPGSLVSLRDRKVFMPVDEDLRQYYQQ